jgi:hypothetical protein
MRARDLERLLIATFVASYLILGQALGEQYPFSPLNMFSEGGEATSRIVLRTEHGLREVTEFTGFRCDVVPDLVASDGASCPAGGRDPERDRAMQDWVEVHGAADADAEHEEPVVLVRLTHRIAVRGGPIERVECELAHCQASDSR